MKGIKIYSIFILVLVFISLAVPVSFANNLEINSQAAVLIDADSGDVLFEKNAKTKLHTASLVKIMTLYLVAEKADMNEVITVDAQILNEVPLDATIIGLKPGEEITVKDAFMASYLISANDAAMVLANHVGEGVDKFVEMMNNKAAQIGAKDTFFKNPTGLTEDKQLSTAYDIALITRAALKNQTFATLISENNYTLGTTNKREEAIELKSNCLLLDSSSSLYMPEAFFGKTGFTSASNATFSAAAKKDGLNFIAVTLNNPDLYDRFKDGSKLLNYGFSNFYKLIITKEELVSSFVGENPNQTIEVKNDVSVLVNSKVSRESITQRIDIKDNMAYVFLEGGGVSFTQQIAEVTTVKKGFIGGVTSFIKFILKILLYAIVAFAIFYILLAIYVNRRHKKRLAAKKRRLDRMREL